MKKISHIALTLCALMTLSACPEQNNAVNISIDPELLKSIAGGKSTDKDTNATGNTDKPDPPTIGETTPVEEVSNDIEEAIFQAIDDNANALNTQDFESFVGTIHPQSQITSAMPDLFILLSQAQTRYNILEKTLQSKSENAATVLVARRTSDITGTINQDILYTMRTDGGTWKVFFMTDQSQAF